MWTSHCTEKCLLIFQNSCLDLHSHLQWMKVLSTTSSPTDNISWLFNCCQSGECEIMPHSSLKLQFLGHQPVWVSLNIYLPFIVFFCEILFMFFSCFFFLLMIHRNFYYALLMSSSPDVCSTNMSSHLVVWNTLLWHFKMAFDILIFQVVKIINLGLLWQCSD